MRNKKYGALVGGLAGLTLDLIIMYQAAKALEAWAKEFSEELWSEN